MTITELRELSLWGMLPRGIQKALEEAASLGWELHGKGATIAFRLDRAQDGLDLPVYALWTIGKTPKGAVSFHAGKAGVPHATLSISDLSEYLKDPSVVYPLETEPAPEEPERAASDLEDSPPWDTTATAAQNLCVTLKAKVIEDKPTPKPLRFPSAPGAPQPSSTEDKVTALPLRV
jgi:hypothetical protein